MSKVTIVSDPSRKQALVCPEDRSLNNPKGWVRLGPWLPGEVSGVERRLKGFILRVFYVEIRCYCDKVKGKVGFWWEAVVFSRRLPPSLSSGSIAAQMPWQGI